MTTLHLDVETRSTVDLKKAGQYVYAQDPTTDLILLSYRFDDGPVKRWRRVDKDCPEDIAAHVRSGGRIVCHNAPFERAIWRFILGPRYGWPVPELEQFFCTAAMARAMGLPADLDRLGQALGLDVQKDKEGHALMMRMMRPRSRKGGEIVWWDDTDFEKVERLHAYCDRDVLTECAAEKKLLPLSPDEREIWLLDQAINDRGIRVDRHACHAALRIVEAARQTLDDELAEVTGYCVTSATQVAKLAEWISSRGVDCTSLAADILEDMLQRNDLPADVKRALEIRDLARRSSTSKVSAFLQRADEDGRMRGCYVYHAASTGRWSSVGAQIHNLMRSTGTVDDPPKAMKWIKTGDPELVELMFGQPIAAVADCVRPMLVAAPGHHLVARDYSNIEGRVNAWCAGEDWKLEAFRAFDEGRGPDLYFVAAGGIYGLDPLKMDKKTHGSERQVGKVAELALGYQGGVAAFYSMAKGYGVDMAPAFPGLWERAHPDDRAKAEGHYEECCKREEETTKALSREAWLASEITKIKWRATNPFIVRLWHELQDAIWSAVESPGTIVSVSRVKYIVKRGYLWCLLPSGRCLAYGNPKVRDVKTPWGERRPAVTALGVNSVTKKWERFPLYGGLACENIVQAIARDLLADAMLRTERAGLPIVMHTHDELVAEVEREKAEAAGRTVDEIMCALPAWAEGLPVAVSGFNAFRYRKD